MDPGRAPPRVRVRHRPNQRSDGDGHRRSSEAASTLPRPPQSETAPVPREDGLRLNDDERRSPSGPEARKQDPEPAVDRREPDSTRSGALQHLQLVPQDWIQKPFSFLGMIGSARKARIISDHFVEESIATAEQIQKIACPVGIDISSRTVEEIAVSIVAQLIEKRAELP